jgi:hypothetical protein
MEKNYRYIGYFLLLLFPIAFLGFYKSYFSQVPDFNQKITGIFHFHVVIAIAWIVMLVLQPILIVNKQVSLHRTVGKSSYILFPLLILSFALLLYHNYTSDHPRSDLNAIGDIILLCMSYGFAIYYRKTNRAKHMRYMIGSATVLLDPTLGRIYIILVGIPPIIAINLVYVTIIAIFLYLIYLDKQSKRDYTAYKHMIWAWVGHYILVIVPILFLKHP